LFRGCYSVNEKSGLVSVPVDDVKNFIRESAKIDNVKPVEFIGQGKRAKESQSYHEGMLSLSKKISELRKNEKEIFKQFSELKKQFFETNNMLKQKLLEANEASKHEKEEHEKEDAEMKERQEKMLAEKETEMTEKIKSGKKLTTEDLLAFQGSSKD